MTDKKLSKQLSGISGEYFVAAELSRRGFLAAITLRNSESIDIFANSILTNKQICIQVKTSQNKRKWPLSEKVERDKSLNKIYVFVNLISKNSLPEYFLIDAISLSKIIEEGHKKWLQTPNKKGGIHNNTKIREFSDFNEKYKDNWEILDKF
ncbi:hypothetical protein [Chryseobacterium sp. NKUCC03_KSP]|uniref:hypothetical protein n=1 Tax=Chryseobacterium sp. NKUCC03_KSP TaxID=2842125 RepID=UPI001C5BECF0|nr:hypothetical protein [Chryseobacterium sp. NKUCC03_KSP]MBW3523479.1 hypothetical protein [Chryseobacterium sp. NKUCC03_KSP]